MKGIGKRGDEIIAPTVVFILFSVFVLVVLAVFIWNSSTSAEISEEAYAKQIASFINKAKPGTTILVDLEGPVRAFSKNKFDEEDFEKVFDEEEFNGIVKVDNEANTITVNLKDIGGYKMQYFSDYFVETDLRSDAYLTIRIFENGEEDQNAE